MARSSTGGRRRPRTALWPAAAAIATTLSLVALPAKADAVAPSPWRGFTNLSGGDETPTFPPSLQANASGTAVAAWHRGTGPDAVVRLAERSFGGPWTTRLSLPGSATAEQPRLSLNENGDAAVGWVDFATRAVRVAVRPNNTGRWLTPEPVPGSAPASGTDVVVGPRGDVVVAWRDAGTGVVRATRRVAATGAWSAAQDVSGAGRSGPVRLAVSANGSIMAQWGAGSGPKETAVSTPGGTWGPPETLPDDGVLAGVSIAMDPRGNTAALELGGTGSDAFAQVAYRPAGVSWGAFERVERPGSTGVSDGSIAFDDDGRALAVWRRSARGASVVQAAERSSDGAWSRGTDVSPTTRRATSPALALAHDGRATVTWREVVDGRAAVRATRRPGPGRAWGEPENVAAPDGGIAPTLAAAATDDHVVALWVRGGFVQAADRTAGEAGEVLLSARQLLINQRISQAAVRRMNAIRSAISEGLPSERILRGALARRHFGAGVEVSGTETGAIVAPGAPAPLAVEEPRERAPGRVAPTAGQLLINQRVAQAAIRRARVVGDALRAGLSGGDVRDGAVTAAKVAPGLSVRAVAPPAAPASPSDMTPTAPRRNGGDVDLTAEQLLINQRISQAAVVRANALRERLELGLPGAAFRDGSITAQELAAGLR